MNHYAKTLTGSLAVLLLHTTSLPAAESGPLYLAMMSEGDGEVIHVHSCPPGSAEYMGGCSQTEPLTGGGSGSGGGSVGGERDPVGPRGGGAVGGGGRGDAGGDVVSEGIDPATKQKIADLKTRCVTEKRKIMGQSRWFPFKHPVNGAQKYMCTYKRKAPFDDYDVWWREVYNANGDFEQECQRPVKRSEKQKGEIPEGTNMGWDCGLKVD